MLGANAVKVTKKEESADKMEVNTTTAKKPTRVEK